MVLTLKDLKEMKPGVIFATGTGTYPELIDKEIRWVAKRGDGYHDWTIYYLLIEHTELSVEQQGLKCFTKSVIKRLVPCTDEAYSLYRF